MSDFELARESIEETFDYNVLIGKFENNYEQRRLKTPEKLLGFKITTPALTKSEMQTYRNFLASKYGALTSFTFTSPFDDTEYDVRFDKGSFRTIFQRGYFKASFAFTRVLP